MSMINKCRTCLRKKNHSKFQQFDQKVNGQSSDTYKDAFIDITNISIMVELENQMPQVICIRCSRQLKAAQAFVSQARKANEALLRSIGDKTDVETFINLPEIVESSLTRIKTETFYGDSSNLIESNILKESGCLQETPIDLPKIIIDEALANIKMETEPVDNIQAMKFENNYIECTPEIHERFIDTTRINNMIFSNDLETTWKNQSLTQQSTISKTCNDTEVNLQNNKYLINGHTEDKNDVNCKLFEIGNNDDGNTTNEDDWLPVRCIDCDRVFENAKQLARHKRNTHIPEELKVSCPICGSRFTKNCNLYTHMRSFHGPESVEEMRERNYTGMVKKFKCDKCACKYTNKYKLNDHLKKKHSNETTNANSKSYNDDQKKSKKIYNYGKRFLCTICGLSFHSQSSLTIHIRRHTGEKPFKCDVCSKAYPRLYDVQMHMRMHTGEKPFVCTICDKAFKRSQKLKVHLRTHTNERPYICTQCERSFKHSKDLNIHKRIHTGERPYKCNVCLHTFTQSNSLKAHRKKYGHLPPPIITETQVENSSNPLGINRSH